MRYREGRREGFSAEGCLIPTRVSRTQFFSLPGAPACRFNFPPCPSSLFALASCSSELSPAPFAKLSYFFLLLSHSIKP